MKRIVYALLFLIFTVHSLFAQNTLTYQMVVRDDSGVLIRVASVGIKVSFISDDPNGAVIYSETHNVTTNRDGLATLKVGGGTIVTGTFSDLDWSNHVYYFKTEVDPNGGTAYSQTYTELIGHAPISNYSVESSISTTIDYNNLVNKPDLFSGYYDSLLNKPVLFSGIYDSLTNKPILFSGVYDSLTNKPTLFDGNYYNLYNLPSILDTIYRILRDSNYLRFFSETQVLSQKDSTISISGGNSITLPKAMFGGKYDSLINRPDLKAIMASALADSNFLKSYTECQQLSLIGDTIYLTNSSPVVLPLHYPDLTSYLFVTDTNQTVAGRKTFTDTILAPTRIDESWNLIGDSSQAVNFKAMAMVLDSLRSKVEDVKKTLYGPIIYTLDIDTTTFPMMLGYGNVLSDLQAPLTARGFCFALHPNPTLTDGVSTDTMLGLGNYQYCFGPMLKDTVYYIRAFATNDYGTNYGNQFVINTPKSATVHTSPLSWCKGNIIKANGEIVDNGGNSIKHRGFCWNNSQNPTVSTNSITAGSGDGTFSITINGLTPMTTYYLRAFAINDVDTTYGNEITFTTTSDIEAAPCPGADSVVKDYDGNIYHTVMIGTQCWMKENLRCTTYNGTPMTYSATYTSTTEKYYYYPNNDANNVAEYGCLYNWPAVTGGSSSSNYPSGIRGICPIGWHVPSNAEFDTLFLYVGNNYSCTDNITSTYYRWNDCPSCWPYTDENGNTKYYTVDDLEFTYYEECDYDCYFVNCGYDGCGDYAITKSGTATNKVRALAASGIWKYNVFTQYLGNEEINKNNASGFSIVPAGLKYESSNYYGFGSQSTFWTTTLSGSSPYYRPIDNSTYSTPYSSTNSKYVGCSVRCLKD